MPTATVTKVEADITSNNGTFDVGESVAAAVFSHVTSTRDRLALSCVSRVWRKVVATEGSWGACDLVIDPELGKRLTNDRFVNLIRRCGDVKHLEVRDADGLAFGIPSASPCLFSPGSSLANTFASLETVKVTNCSNMSSSGILAFMKAVGMLDRPKEKRLRCLRLAGCDMHEAGHLDELNECLSIGQQEVFFERRTQDGQENVLVRKPYTTAKSIIGKSSFDMWQCEGWVDDNHRICHVATSEEVVMCDSCLKTFCSKCAEDFGTHHCDTCNFFVCDDSDCEDSIHLTFCDGCDRCVCEDCGHDPSIVRMCSDGKKECNKTYCADCAKEKNYFFIDCFECWGTWCEDCDQSENGPGMNMCTGKGGCWESKCRSCLDAKDLCYGFCEVCEEQWCPDCDPIVTAEYKLKRKKKKKKKKKREAVTIQCCPACKESLPTNPDVQLWLKEQKNDDFWMWRYKKRSDKKESWIELARC
tara:strand:+ start:5075 stop:6493 length:1419 start_codon:yes stop_codon:yes gene_type:complete